MTYQKSPEKSCFVRFSAFLLAIVFVPACISAVMMFNINTVLLDRQTWKNALTSQDSYKRIPLLTAEQMTYTAPSGDCVEDSCQLQPAGSMVNFLPVPSAYLTNMDQTTWNTIFSGLMQADWVQSQAESVVDQLFDSLNSIDKPIGAVISLESMRSRLTDADYQNISRTVLATAPVCNEGELLSYAAVLMGGSADNLPFCIPTEELRPMVESAITTTAWNLVQSLPAEITFEADTFFKPSHQTDENGEIPAANPSNKLKWMRLGFMICPLIPLILLGFLGTTAVRSWGDAGRWLGLPLSISGLTIMLLAIIVLLASPWLVSSFLLPRLTVQVCPGIVHLIQDVARAVAVRYALWNGIIAGVLFLGGALSYAVFSWYRSKKA